MRSAPAASAAPRHEAGAGPRRRSPELSAAAPPEPQPSRAGSADTLPGRRPLTEVQDLGRPGVLPTWCAALEGEHQCQRFVLVLVRQLANKVQPTGGN